MSLFVRYQAWLNAAPQGPPQNGKYPPAVSRLEKLRTEREDEDYVPPMPPTDATYMLEYFFEIGPATGDNVISWSEIRSWEHLTGIVLDAWEARFLRSLSREYLAALRRSEKEGYPAPWQADEGDDRVDLAIAARSLRESMRELAKL